jgi:hypothetical protein
VDATRKVRPGPAWGYVTAAVVIPLLVVAVVAGQIGALMPAGLLAALWAYTYFRSSIQVSPSTVRVAIVFMRVLEAPRNEIRTMHLLSGKTAFEGADGSVVLLVDGVGWGKNRLLDVSEALGVPLYDHRIKMGLSDQKVGVLVQRSRGAK